MRERLGSSRLLELTFPIFQGRSGTRRFGGYSLYPLCTEVQEGATAVWMDLDVVVESGGVSCGCCLTSLQPWRLTARGSLLWTSLHQVKPSRGFLSSEGARLRGLMNGPRTSTSLEPVQRFVLLLHTISVTL